MTVGAAIAGGAGLVVTLVMIAVAVAKAHGEDVEAEDLDLPGPQFFRAAVAVFGGLGAVVAVGIAIGWFLFDLSLAAVGLDASPVRGAAVGAVVGAFAAGGHYLLIRGLKWLGLPFTEVFGEMTPDTVPELGWYGSAVAVQATAEEVVFRAALVGALAALLSTSAWYLVVPAAVLFGFAHTGRGAGSVVSTTAMGVLFGVVFVQFGLVAAAVAHVVNNVVGLAYGGLIAESSEDADEEPTVPPTEGVGD